VLSVGRAQIELDIDADDKVRVLAWASAARADGALPHSLSLALSART
jgi:hypothetical protein